MYLPPPSPAAAQLEELRLVLNREFRELESQAKDAEKEAHKHSRQSAIGPDGMVIPAVARKKRRLDEELEGLLEAMEVLMWDLTGCFCERVAATPERKGEGAEGGGG